MLTYIFYYLSSQLSINEEDDGSGGNYSSENESEDEYSSYSSLFKSFANQWQHGQLTHHVSLTAATAFWDLAFKYVSDLSQLKAQENNHKKTPGFLHVRKQIYKDLSPDVKMSFAFKKKTDGSIVYVKDDITPLKKYQRDPEYEKLYEEAHVEVIVT